MAAPAGNQLDLMGDLVAVHLDTAALSRLIEEGPPSGLPVIPPAGAVALRSGASSSQFTGAVAAF